MKKSIVGVLALSTLFVGMSAFKNSATSIAKNENGPIAYNGATQDGLKGMNALQAIGGGSITGKILPIDGAAEVEAVNGETKLKSAVSNGAFTFPEAPAGTYTITILAKSPYKNAVIKDLKVEEGKAVDLGEIKLEQ